MSEKDLKAIIDHLVRLRQKLEQDPEARKAFFIRAGILTKRGMVRTPYQGVCTPIDPV